MDLVDLEARLRAVEARLALGDLVARYCIAIDDQDYEGLAELFAADATWPFPDGEARGRTAVVAALRERRSGNAGSVHTPHACVVTDLGERHASGTVLAHVEMGIGGTTHMGALRYTDRYARGDDGRWRFLRREMTVVHMGPWADIERSLV
ncbi:nuclear transport factor 2 family protein [Streptomyces spongiae]|nr:nuclear transport factor 2 family protein [Streptomyces spongiae]